MNYTGRFALATIQPDASACDGSAWRARRRCAGEELFDAGQRSKAATATARRRLGQPMRCREEGRAAGAAGGAVAAGAVALQQAAARLPAPEARQHADAAQPRHRSDELQGEDAAVCADG